jgi:uncharacterized protein YdhG (YjbR/CyaY superfamily)
LTRWRSEVQVLYGAGPRPRQIRKQLLSVKNFSNVEAYIANATPAARNKLRELRRCIQSILTSAEEKIWYGVPFYHQDGEVAGLSVARHHVSLGVGSEVLPTDRRQKLEAMGYHTGSCTVQIRFDQKLPVALLRKMLREKVKLNQSKS